MTEDQTTAEVHQVEDEDQCKNKERLEMISKFLNRICLRIYFACRINYKNMKYLESGDLNIILGNDKHLLGSMIEFRHLLRQWDTDSSTMSDTTKEGRKCVNVLNILQHSSEGKAFLSNYREQIPNDALRQKLVYIILKEIFAKDMAPLSRPCLNDMASQICKIFTKEKKHVYYQKLRNREPTGFLYAKYSNMRHAQLETQKRMVSNETNNESETVQEECSELVSDPMEIYENESNDLSVHEQSNELQCHAIEIHDVNSNESDQCSTNNVDASLKFIKDYTTDCSKELLLDHWKKTFEYRQKQIEKYEDSNEAFVEWPPLKNETGHALLCMDFVLKYGVKISNGLNNWNSFFEKNLATITGSIKNSVVKRNLNGLTASTSVEAKNKIIIMALHHLFVPSVTIVNGDAWKPTVDMSQKSFLKVVNGQSVMLSSMAKRNDFCKRYGMKNHPLIYEITTCMGTRYNVCIENHCYTVDSLIEGVDVAYKIFKILNIEFPLESKKVWKFIEQILYYGDDGDISGKLLSIICDMNKD